MKVSSEGREMRKTGETGVREGYTIPPSLCKVYRSARPTNGSTVPYRAEMQDLKWYMSITTVLVYYILHSIIQEDRADTGASVDSYCVSLSVITCYNP